MNDQNQYRRVSSGAKQSFAISTREPNRKAGSLSANELATLTLFANGRTAKEMAVELGVSQSMAHYLLRVAARKLRARNRVHAVAIAVRRGVINSPR